MTPEEKVEVTETTDSKASAIHPFDRYMSAVIANKAENDPAAASQNAGRAPAQSEQPSPSNNAAGESLSGSEKLRNEIIARAREADTRARAAEEKARQFEAKLRQEQALRALADQRSVEIEEEYKQRLAAAQGADFSRLELELALAESEAKLKKEGEARWLADTVLNRTREEAKAIANSAALAAEEAEKRIIELEGELESRDRDLEETTESWKSATLAWREAERRIAELENALAVSARAVAEKAVAAEAAERGVEPVIREAEARAAAAEHKLGAAEARLQFEIDMRTAAEQKIQFLENEFKRDLEMDWARFEADIEKAEAAVRVREESIAKTSAEHARREAQDLIHLLSSQLEGEQRARSEVERRLLETEASAENLKEKFNYNAERRLAEVEAALKAANSARAEAERKLGEVEPSHVPSFLRNAAHTAAATGHRITRAEPRTIDAEFKPRGSEKPIRKPPRGGNAEPAIRITRIFKKSGLTSSLLTLGLTNEPHLPSSTQDTSRKEEIKLVGYVAAISLLLLVLIVLGLTAYRLL